MNSKTHLRSLLLSLLALTATTALIVGCSSTSTSNPIQPASQTGPAFIVGTDAPAVSVVSFAVQINSLTATDANNNTVSLISGTPTVDFARFNGLQTLLDLNDVPAGTYTSITATFGTATIGYLNTSQGNPATIVTEPATLSSNSITDTLTTPLVVASAGTPVGLRMDFNLRKSIEVDGNGNITGQVNPTLDFEVVQNSDPGAYIDEFIAAVTSVNVNAGTFTMTGPHGRSWTVVTNGGTEWENGETINNLTTSSIVRISGYLDRADATFDADTVGIISQDGFYAGGLCTYVTPMPGQATSFDLYVRGVLPTTTGLTLGQIAQVNLTGNEKFFIYEMHNPLTQYIFNSSLMLPGQHILIGGPASGATNPNAVTVKRVVLAHDGINGTVSANNLDPGAGTFQITANGFKSLLIPQTITVVTSPKTDYRDGLTGINDITAGMDLRIVGLLIKDPATGNTLLLARYVDELQ